MAPLHPKKNGQIASAKSRRSLKDLTRGTVFAQRYEVIEEMGSGGLGSLFRVLDNKTNEEVALRIIKPELTSDETSVNRFGHELKLARKISHKNIGRMYHFGEDQGIHFLTMEYVQGETLKSMIKMTGQMSLRAALYIARQVSEGLAEALHVGLLHRDLRPGNILIDKDGNAKIMEIGIAQSLKTDADSGSGVISGSSEYSSPEQFEGEEVDTRSDIYSLGVILYELLTGRVPFEGETDAEIVLKQKMEAPPDPREFNTQISYEVSQLVLKCLKKRKEERFENPEILASELKSLENFLPAVESGVYESEPSGSSQSWPPFYLKGRWRLVGMAAAVIVLIVGGFLLVPRQAPVLEERKIMLLVLPFVNLGQPDDEYFADGLTEEITSRLSSLDGLGVISRTSAKQYKNTDRTTKQIGRELGVDYIFEGTIQWIRDEEGQGRILVIPQLIRVDDDTQIWNERYNRVIEDIFSLQSEIAEKVIQQLDLAVLEPERKALMASPTSNIEAYDYYLRGRQQAGFAWNTSNLADYESAVEFLNRAIELDPDFAIAYITLSITHLWAFSNGVDRTEERLDRARDAVYRALEIDPDLPDAQLALGFYYYQGYQDYDRALEIFEAVYRARPNLPYTYLGYILRRQGRWDESTTILEDSFKLNPLNADLAYQIGLSYVCMRRYDEAGIWFDRAISIDPNYFFPLLAKTRLPVLKSGDLDEAHELLLQLPDFQMTEYTWYIHGLLERRYTEVIERLENLPDNAFIGNTFYIPTTLALATTYYLKKDTPNMRTFTESARFILEDLVQKNPEDPRYHASLGLVFAYLGQKNEAIQEGLRSVEMFPVSKDAFDGPRYILNLAKIYTVVGEKSRAIELLEDLLSLEAGTTISRALLRIDPIWDPLREVPQFQRLLERTD